MKNPINCNSHYTEPLLSSIMAVVSPTSSVIGQSSLETSSVGAGNSASTPTDAHDASSVETDYTEPYAIAIALALGLHHPAPPTPSLACRVLEALHVGVTMILCFVAFVFGYFIFCELATGILSEVSFLIAFVSTPEALGVISALVIFSIICVFAPEWDVSIIACTLCHDFISAIDSVIRFLVDPEEVLIW